MSDIDFLSNTDAPSGGGGGVADWLNLAVNLAQLADQPDTPVKEGKRLSQVSVLGARVGSPIPRLYGRMRIGGQLIWHDKPVEHVNESGGGGDGKGSSEGSSAPIKRDFFYSISFAIALCEGPISRLGRVWADSVLLDAEQLDFTLYRGTPDQPIDPLIDKTRQGGCPAYRGLAYIIIRDFDLAAFGNRIPQFSFEVFAELKKAEKIAPKAVAMLPGATEFGYHPEPHLQFLGRGRVRGENLNASALRSDWEIAIDQLQETHPDCQRVALVVTWFGNSLDAANCALRPGIEHDGKATYPQNWQVANIGRGGNSAHRISVIDGRPSFGGTPSDHAVRAAIIDLKERGFEVLFYPFIMMDVPPNNRLADPYGRARQPAYPWRGRMTCNPAPAQSGSPNGSSQINNIIGDFVNGRYSGDLFCLRGMVRHYARLCADAGGVEAFLLASEMRGLSRLRDETGGYPFAAQLAALAQLVRHYLPDSKISYAADWSEYGAHVPQSGAVDFPLDEFWSDENCDFIGIDAYFPLADWRDGYDHLDAQTDVRSPIEQGYLQSQIEGGEYYDWYYADDAARLAQQRSPISDGQTNDGEAWLYKAKDIRNWWQNPHRPRRANQQLAATDWQPRSKPIWFTELGCPAVDKGANQPNVFPDSLSSEGAIPHFSTGQRDDAMQQAYLQAWADYFSNQQHNPVSPLYNAPMLDVGHIYIWAWDARPFPAFPYRTDVWADGANWHTGHWINGRQASAPLMPLIETLGDEGGVVVQSTGLSGTVEGFALAGITSLRERLKPLVEAFGLDVISGSQQLIVNGRGQNPPRLITDEDIIFREDNPVLTFLSGDAAARPNRFDLHYFDADSDYAPQMVSARFSGPDKPVARLDVPLALSFGQAQALVDRLLIEARQQGEQVQLILSPRHLDLEPGDIISVENRQWRVIRIAISTHIEITAQRHEAGLYGTEKLATGALKQFGSTRLISRPDVQLIELPAALSDKFATTWPIGVPMLAACAVPWPGNILVEFANGRSVDIATPSIIGETHNALAAGPIGRWDRFTTLDVGLACGALESISEAQILAGGNYLALNTPSGWEVIQFANAELISADTYRLSHLLRGAHGSDAFMVDSLPAGAECIVLGAGLVAAPLSARVLPDVAVLDFGSPLLPRDGYGWQSRSVPLNRMGLTCLSPVHLRAARQPDGALLISWIRRVRLGGDDFAAAHLPLDEGQEAYQMRVFAGDAIILSQRSTAPQLTIAADIWQDLIGQANNAPTRIEVRQINARGLLGHPAHITLNFDEL